MVSRTVPVLAVALAAPLAGQSTGPAARTVPTVPAACADSMVPPPERREPGSYRPPLRRQIAVPPLAGVEAPDGAIGIEFLVSPRGTVDSVAIVGEVTPHYRQSLVATLLTHTFWPATYRGCAVPGRMSIELSFR